MSTRVQPAKGPLSQAWKCGAHLDNRGARAPSQPATQSLPPPTGTHQSSKPTVRKRQLRTGWSTSSCHTHTQACKRRGTHRAGPCNYPSRRLHRTSPRDTRSSCPGHRWRPQIRHRSRCHIPFHRPCHRSCCRPGRKLLRRPERWLDRCRRNRRRTHTSHRYPDPHPHPAGRYRCTSRSRSKPGKSCRRGNPGHPRSHIQPARRPLHISRVSGKPRGKIRRIRSPTP